MTHPASAGLRELADKLDALSGLRVSVQNYVSEVCDSVTESTYTTVWKLPEVTP